ncbi:paramyosin-like [Gigantopelta aegis]|uniref:paramyosin-like n=1 Tax=Gigantopelta aegis TaxID=1735272 RepID=UPI001B88AD57|nr:paramyosin-like [Gigantopelta aegis]
MQDSSGSPERLPRELIHTQNERLTTKHIQTLSFLQDLANENKELKAKVQELEEQQSQCATLHALAENSQSRIKDIQQQYLTRSDEINSMLAEKHKQEILQLVDEKVELERNCYEEILGMKLEIQALQQENAELMCQLENVPQSDDLAEVKLQDAEREIKRLKAEYEKLHKVSENQATDLLQMQELITEKQTLQQRLQESSQKKDELEMRIDRLQKAVQEAESNKELVELVQRMKTKLEKLMEERESYRTQQEELIKQVHELNAENNRLKSGLIKLEQQKHMLTQELEKAYLEIHALRKQLLQCSDKQTFKDFVLIKRELNLLKDENQVLKSRTKLPSLPMLKPDRPTSASKGAGQQQVPNKSLGRNGCGEKNSKKQLALPACES